LSKTASSFVVDVICYNFYMSLINKIKTKLQRLYELGKKAARVLFNEGISSLLKKITEYLRIRKAASLSAIPQTLETADQVQVLPPILVYQMGRVGSKSIQASLEQVFNNSQPPRPIYHAHWMNNFDVLEQRAKIDLVDPSKFGNGIKYARETFQQFLNMPKLKIVSVVRDPVARNVSTFFYALDEFIPDWEDRRSKDSLTVDDLHNVFVTKRSFALSALNWFDEQMAPVFNIDVFAVPFPQEKGYKIYSSDNVDLLLLRFEDLSRCVQGAFREFLDIEHFELLKVNVGEERKAGSLYKLFTKKPLSPEYVQWTYSSKLARHFYTEAELKAFTRSWVE
jgi:hypothetical protein